MIAPSSTCERQINVQVPIPAPRHDLGLVTAALLAGHAAQSLAADYATILMYHRFGEDRYPSTNVTLEQFEEHLEVLASGPYNVMLLDEVVSTFRPVSRFPTGRSPSPSMTPIFRFSRKHFRV